MVAERFASFAIPHLYQLGERSMLLRGSVLRHPVQDALAGLSRRFALSAREAFDAASSTPSYLPADMLPAYHQRFVNQETRKDNRSPKDKSLQRADEVLRSIGAGNQPLRILDLACGDGAVGEHIAAKGHSVLGIDLNDQKVKPKIPFRAMNAQKMDLDDGSFDAVFTFDAFEHFGNPRAVLCEIHRILKPQGHLYASFGPLWNSPMGPHQWACVDAPYIHQVFRAKDIDAYAKSIGKKPLAVNQVNRWPLARFREMFDSLNDRFETVCRYEKYNVTFADVIAEFPNCFKAKSDLFDEFVVRAVEVVLMKR